MKMRRVLALVMTVLMVIGMMPAISAVQNQEPAVDDYFTVTKTAEATDVPGIYDIKVTVAPKGKVDVVSGDVEVVFLLDTSGSMAWCTDPNHDHRDSFGGHPCKREEYDSRLKIAQNAISNTISSLNTAFQNSGSTLTVSVVTYASEPSVKVDKAVVTNETLGQITKKVSDITSLGGTYMESGLKKASLQFSSGNSSKYLIMIGDGDYDDEDYFDGFLFWGKWNYATDRIKDAASAITKKGATLMTVGFTQDIAIFREIASKDSNGQPMYSRADSDVALNNILEDIASTISADGIILNDNVGAANTVLTGEGINPSVTAGNIKNYSESNISWEIPSGTTDAMTLKYRISVDPSKLNVGSNVVDLNGTTEISYKTSNSEGTKTLGVDAPQDTLTVGKLEVKYYLGEDEYTEKSEIQSKFVTDNETFFEDPAHEQKITVTEGDNQKTYEFEKAVLGTEDYNFDNSIKVEGVAKTLEIYYKEETVETPAFRVEFNANGGYWTDGTDVDEFLTRDIDIFETTESITAYDVKKDNAEFIGWYIKADDGNIHQIDFDRFGYDEAKLFADENLYPYFEGDDGVKTFAVFAQYEENAEQTYTVTYEFVSDDPNAPLSPTVNDVLPTDDRKYAKDADVEIAAEPADATFYGYTWTFLRWEINGEKVDAGSTQKMPEGGLKIVGIWTCGVPEYGVTYEYKESANEPLPDEVKDTLPHDEYTYSANQEVSIKRPTPDSVTTSDGTVWTFEGWTLNGVSVSGSVQMDKELLSDDGVLAFVGTWKSEKADPTPDAPVVDVKVIVSCVNDPNGTDDKPYYVNPGNPGLYTVERNGVFEENGTYKYVINLINAYFVKQYSKALNIEHTLAENVEAKVTYTYDKERGLWIPDKETVTINVVCRQDPDPEEYTVVINFDKTSGTWADNSNDGTKTIAFNENDTTTRNVPKVKESTFKGWYSGNTRIAIGDTLNLTQAMQIVKDLGIAPTEADGIKHYEVTLYADYSSTTTPDYPPFIVLFPTLEISNKVIAPKNFEKTSFEYDIINVKTGDVEKSVTLKADSSVRVMVTGGTEYMVVPKNLEVPGYIVTTTSTPDSATVTSDKIGNVSVDFTHIYVVGLNTEDHYAYIRGYEDGTIRPEGNITRAEVATIFYRLLSSEALAAFKTTENTFTDVDSDAWYNLSVSTLAKAGVISGYPDGSFNPNGKITRAELVSIATRFFTTIEVGDSKFSDIAGHWAAKAIDEAYIKGIIKGYNDGTFRPDQAVTRAEAMKIVNGILGRPIDTCVLIEGIKLWPDVASDAWYYYVVAEATNAHRYELTTPEKWTEIIIDVIEY